jgi:preprotein translocase subunit SecD
LERSLWIRLGVIGAAVLGSVYFLLPTVLQDTTIDTDSIKTAPVAKEPPLQMWFKAADGTADEATATAVTERLQGAGLPVDRAAVDGERLIIYLRPGALKPVIEGALGEDASRITVWGPEAFGIDPVALGALPDTDWETAVRSALVAQPKPKEGYGATGAMPTVTVTEGAVRVNLNLTEPLVTDPLVFVAGGAKAIGFIHSAAAVGDFAPLNVGDAVDPAWNGLPPLPEVLTRVLPPTEAELAAATKTEEKKEEEVVTGWKAWLPSAKISLGLDLQGGIDLTLQVDQDAAIDATVVRDRRLLADAAAKDAFEGVTIDRDRTRPALKIAYDGDFAKLKEFVSSKLGNDYAYTQTVEEDGKKWNLWLMNPTREAKIRDDAVEQNLETIRKRVNSTGVKEPSIVKMGGSRINIQLPGVKDAQSAISAVGTQATLEFRMVDEKADDNQVARNVADAQKAMPADQFDDQDLLNLWLKSQGKLADGRIIMWEYEETTPGAAPVKSRPVQLVEDIVLTGADVESASVGFDQSNQPRVMMGFKPRGSQVFCDVTKANVGKRFAIILDDQIRSAPNIREAICGGSASIEMGNSTNAIDEANTLALVLRSGALTAPVDVGQVSQIGATLGADAINSGVRASLMGSALVFVFMVLWYGMSGLIADITLIVNVLLVFAFMAIFGATLTLPGVAGIALTVGMAVDANIIFYERIREELALGAKPKKAVDAGFGNALPAVIDANVTTAIAGIVLYSYGTGPIKGFAVTLLIGIVTTLMTAIYVSRTLMDVYVRNNTRLRL